MTTAQGTPAAMPEAHSRLAHFPITFFATTMGWAGSRWRCGRPRA